MKAAFLLGKLRHSHRTGLAGTTAFIPSRANLARDAVCATGLGADMFMDISKSKWIHPGAIYLEGSVPSMGTLLGLTSSNPSIRE